MRFELCSALSFASNRRVLHWCCTGRENVRELRKGGKDIISEYSEGTVTMGRGISRYSTAMNSRTMSPNGL